MTNAGGAVETQPAPVMWKLPGVRLFASGHYPGQPIPDWPPAKVDAIAAECKRLGPGGVCMILPPAVLGHEENQDWLADTSLPAAGWVDPDSVHTIPDDEYPGHRVLIGDVVDVPEEVKILLDSGKYKFGSGEFYQPKDDFGRPQGMTLRRFGLLGGGTIPNVKRLGPLPKPVEMPGGVAKFGEHASVAVRPGEVAVAFAERQSMDRTQLIVAMKAGFPSVSQATLDILSDDQLKEFVMSVPAPTTPAAPVVPAVPPAVATMAEPTRDEMIAALVAAGQPQDVVAAWSDADVKAAYDLIKPPVAALDDAPKDKPDDKKPDEVAAKMGEVLAKMKADQVEFHRFSEQQRRELKLAKVEPVCAKLIHDGFSPSIVNEWIKPQLLASDDTQAIHRFSEDGVQKSGTAFAMKLAAAKTLNPAKCFVKLGEKIPGGGSGDAGTPEAKKAVAVQKAKEHAATIGDSTWKQTSFRSADGFVAAFGETFDKNPEVAMKMLA